MRTKQKMMRLCLCILLCGAMLCQTTSAEGTPFHSPMVVKSKQTGADELINATGKVIFSAPDGVLNVTPMWDNVYCIEKMDDNGLSTYAICDDRHLLTDFAFSHVDTASKNTLPILASDLQYQYGYIDLNGQWVILPQWVYAAPFSEGLAYVESESGIAFLDQLGSAKLEFSFAQMLFGEPFSEGLALVRFVDQSWGYIDINGNITIKNNYIEASSFHDDYALVKDERGYFFIDHSGIAMAENRWKYAQDFQFGFAIVAPENGQYGVIDTQGNVIFPFEANHIIDITAEQLCWISTKNASKFGLYNLQTKAFLTPECYDIPFPEGFVENETGFIVKRDGLYGFLSKEGEVLIPCVYEFLYFGDDGSVLKAESKDQL